MSLTTGQTIPLTTEQRAWLRINSVLPISVLLGMLVVGAVFGSCIVGRFFNTPFVSLLLVGVSVLFLVAAILTGRYAYQHYADLRLGVASVHDAQLVHKLATERSPRTFFAEFEGIGSLLVLYDQYQPLIIGQRYRLIYSPHTKRAWAIEPL